MAKDTPVNEVLKMLNAGNSESNIIRFLSGEGYSPVQITDALNQAKIKKEITPEGLTPSIMNVSPGEASVPRPSSNMPRPMAVPPMEAPPLQVETNEGMQEMQMPAEYPSYPYQYPTASGGSPQPPQMDTEAIEEIAEEIISEKWLEIKNKVSDVIDWKAYADKRIVSLDDRLKRIETSLDRLQGVLLSKVGEYSRDIKDLGAEMAGIEGAFGKILSPFVENMKELSKITGELKKIPSPKMSSIKEIKEDSSFEPSKSTKKKAKK